jgi:O-antigen/teichoic acid export membrane protein
MVAQLASRSVPVRLSVMTAWSIAGNAIYGLGQWAMVVLLARMGSREMVGDFALALAVAAPIDLFGRLGLRTIQATDAARSYRFGQYLGLRLAMSSLTVLVTAVVAIALGYSSAIVQVTALVAVAKSFEAISDVAYGQMQLRDRLDLVAGSLSIKSVLSLALLYLGVRYGGTLVAGAAGLAVAWAVVVALRDAPVVWRLLASEGRSADFRPVLDWGATSSLVKLTWPLGAVATLGSLRVNLPRLLVEHRLGVGDLGALAAMSYLVVVGGRFVSSVLQALAAPVGRALLDGDRARLRRVGVIAFSLAIGAGLLGTVVAMVAGRPLVVLVYGSEYAGYVGLLIVLMLAATFDFVSSVLQLLLTSLRLTGWQLAIRSVGVGTTVLGCLLLLGAYGVLGAGGGLLVGAVLECALAGALVARGLRRWARSV